MATILDSVVYIFDVHWNERDGAWYFDLLSNDETMLRAGVKVVLGTVLGFNSGADMPTGLLIARDRTNAGIDAGLDDLGGRVVVDYWTVEEIEAFS